MKTFFEKLRNLFITGRQDAITTPVQPDRDKLSTEKALIDEYMYMKKPFLYNRYSIFQLSEETGICMFDLMAIIHRQHRTNFNDFLDSYRISYCKQLLDQVPLYTLDVFDLTVICGFTDQERFCAAFKKVTRVPVSKYIRKLCRDRL